jgi:hypothetical protein
VKADQVVPHGTYGRLDDDAVADAPLCHVCGRWVKNWVQRARLSHELSAADYRELAGLNRVTRLITPTMQERLREASAPVIARLQAEGKLRHWDEGLVKWQRDKAAAVDVLHEGLRREGRQNRSAGFTAERRQDDDSADDTPRSDDGANGAGDSNDALGSEDGQG